MPQELTLNTRWINLAAKRFHEDGGQPVIALHGWLDNAASFAPLAALLPNLDILALDLPGHGLSDHRPAGQHYHFVDFVADVIAAANAAGRERFSLIGHSMGAGIASLIAASFPERIERLVLIEGLGPWGDDPKDCASHLAEATRQILAEPETRTRCYSSLEPIIRARMQAGDLGEATARLLVERNTASDPGGVYWRTDPRLRYRSPIYITEEQVQAFLPCIKAPTLFIRDAERIVPAQYNWNQRESLIADLQVVKLTGGHHLHMENPAPVAQAIQAFFAA
ncbi:alpha/beta fold hydrolase [Sedimenticola sp.]|uniref:alpha/beta fold hydrolase n=1 Tax=Sedimenticola sp. TaxID=1940285 RepID=UPI00258CD8B7|nr:alpha/beta hydrolase [Sedimenticola sp.]MCW8903153.1 alpha/beta hydrolase [Sedimenticola sp.]